MVIQTKNMSSAENALECHRCIRGAKHQNIPTEAQTKVGLGKFGLAFGGLLLLLRRGLQNAPCYTIVL